MKTLLTFALAMSMFLTGFAEPTNELAALSSVSFNEQNAKITLLEGIGKVKISIKDIKGRTLYCISHKVSESVVMPLNLEALPVGEYVIRIQTKDSLLDYKVETSAKKEKVKLHGFNATVKAIDDRFVKVSLYENFEKGGVTVKVYDSSHRLIYKENVKDEIFARRYEFKNQSTRGLYFSITDTKGNNKIYYI